ncbi:hypothetical protein [Microcoleus sp. FACHB-68]|uniref:hypothetical protein n=1 Tax=Microcoleus sp. FACHB-68 TaxID=2692826 RepID=UPI0016849082|nr:hypothetical protein [Microcoleus sp. FACHB-68]MBD1937431.1 hypothetical protein [Microcoleus sp. FACHB-68]
MAAKHLSPPPSSESMFCTRCEKWDGTHRHPRMLHLVAVHRMPVTIACVPIPGNELMIICCLD